MKTILNQDTGYKVSTKYQPITTNKLIARLESSGYKIRQVQAARVLKAEKQGFQRHLIRLQRQDQATIGRGQSFPEILLKNSYDGSQALSISLGIYRLVCSNGLIVGSTFEEVKLKHTGAIVDKIEPAIETVLKQADKLDRIVKSMEAQQLVLSDSQHLVKSIVKALVPEAVACNLVELLKERRTEDRFQDVYTVMNRIQENIMRGRLKYAILGKEGKVENKTFRAPRAIDKNIKVNKIIWDQAERLVA